MGDAPEEQFYAAVELIKNLPKSGTFNPSNDLKLKFYSYFKQATEGPCEVPKPGFWDIISRAKWEAWKGLGDMPKEEAMQHYVDEFFQICLKLFENTTFDENNRSFMELMEPLIKHAPKKLRESHSRVNGNSSHDQCRADYVDDPYYNLNESVEVQSPKGKSFKGKDVDNRENNNFDPIPLGHQPDIPSAINGHNVNGGNESDSEEFSDTFDKVNEDSDEELVSSATVVEASAYDPSVNSAKGASIVQVRGGGDQRPSARDGNSPLSGASGSRSHRPSHQGRTGTDSSLLNAPVSSISGGSGGSRRSGGNVTLEPTEVSEQLALAVIKLQHTMDQVVNRLDSLEILLQERRNNPCKQVSKMNSSFWSLFGISPRAAVLILAWPFIAHWLINAIQKRRRR